MMMTTETESGTVGKKKRNARAEPSGKASAKTHKRKVSARRTDCNGKKNAGLPPADRLEFERICRRLNAIECATLIMGINPDFLADAGQSPRGSLQRAALTSLQLGVDWSFVESHPVMNEKEKLSVVNLLKYHMPFFAAGGSFDWEGDPVHIHPWVVA